jgi:hypothetical protein
MSCQNFQTVNPVCRTIQLIEPEDTLLTSITSSGGRDQSLDESGSMTVPIGPHARLFVPFETQKISANYRFEYLYIDALGISNPGNVEPVVVDTTLNGFLVDLAGLPLAEGYILRWRVVVQDVTINLVVDAPESLRLQLNPARTFTGTFINPRSTALYGFSELRVENLTDPVDFQRIVNVQVVSKTQLNFTVGMNPPPDSNNYYLVARTP